MPVYKYTAQTKEGQMVGGTIEAVNLNLAIDTLTASKLKILEIKPLSFDPFAWMRNMGGISREAVVLMTRRLGAMLKAGLPVARAMQVLHDQESDRKLKAVLMNVLHDIRVGSTLSWSLGKHPQVFGCLFISMVKVGETTGDLSLMLDKLSDFLERDLAVRKQAQSAMAYPMFVLVFCLGTVAGIFLYVLPQIFQVFTELATELPLPTKIMLFIITTLKNPYVQLASILGGIYYFIYFRDYIKTAEGKFRFDRLKVTIPLLGGLNKKLIIANFCRALGVLLSTGIPILRAIEILVEFMENDFFRQIVLKPMYEEIKEGSSVTQAIHNQASFFPLMTINMIAVGENTGEMPQMLNKISHFYDGEIVYAVETFLNLLEPLMICFMGLVVCFVLLSIFLPLYSIILNLG
ncbi:MAG: type II secretion system F family protein [Candidatus Eremiobacteraeota bacterium]|nr:type II secretion system F family protein [Candidatus Eremiobacteraeota bacterium]